MLAKVQKNLEQLNILPEANCSQVLIATVSGGADSVCLLLILKELQKRIGYELEAVHVEHGIRGEESKRDEAFVKDLCKSLLVPCHVVHVDVPGFCQEQGVGDEEGARLLRYRAFSEYALSRGGKVVLAHHMEDQAETVIFQLLRGSSLTGLCGIGSSRVDENGVTYLRPLLNIRRSEIMAYLEAVGQEFCIDSTNLETEYHRNYIRREILPRMMEINGAAVPHISRTAARLTEVRDFLREETKKAMNTLVTGTGSNEQEEGANRKNPSLQLDIAGFRQLHGALQKEVIYEMIATVAGGKKDITSTHVEEVLSIISSQSGKRVTLPDSIVARKSFDILVVEKKTGTYKGLQENSAPEQRWMISEEMLKNLKEKGLPVTIPVSESGEGFEVRVFEFSGNQEEIPKKSYTKWFDYDKIKEGFCIRNRENGDFLINDEKGHHKKLKSYFIDEKIPLEQRDSMWLLAQDSHVLWLVGGRISEHVKVSKDTKTVIEIYYIGGN